MKIATWNINGIRARLDGAVQWAREAAPDVLCFQEIKTEDASFPRQVFEDLGYNIEVNGQKGFNGVALLSKLKFDEVSRGLPGLHDEQARFLEAVFSLPGSAIRVASCYFPNGNPPASDKFAYKLEWMGRFEGHARSRLAAEEACVFAGDFNVIPEPEDAHNPANWGDDALYQPETRRAFRRILNHGLTDAFRACHGDPGHYTFWDYQAGAWQKNNGIRIDHMLLSPLAADRLTSAAIDKRTRSWDKPSDHVPLMIELAV